MVAEHAGIDAKKRYRSHPEVAQKQAVNAQQTAELWERLRQIFTVPQPDQLLHALYGNRNANLDADKNLD